MLLLVLLFCSHSEHLFIVCELLRDNLYEFSKHNREVIPKTLPLACVLPLPFVAETPPLACVSTAFRG